MATERNTYDEYATEYARWRQNPRHRRIPDAAVLDKLLACAGQVSGLTVLDAGCGEGFVSRILADKGAKVIAVDAAARLIELARSRSGSELIEYRVHDLSHPMLGYQGHFDLVVAHQVLNDVPDYRGFIATLGAVIKPGGARRVVTQQSLFGHGP